jgi:hypothetical protein
MDDDAVIEVIELGRPVVHDVTHTDGVAEACVDLCDDDINLLEGGQSLVDLGDHLFDCLNLSEGASVLFDLVR